MEKQTIQIQTVSAVVDDQDEVQGYVLTSGQKTLGRAACWTFAGIGAAAVVVGTGGVGIVAAGVFAGAGQICSEQY